MIFLAILKDSLREAIAVRVFPLMVLLTIFTGLFVGSIRFVPLEEGPGLETVANQFFGANRAWWDSTPPPVRYHVTYIDPSGEAEPWRGEHHFQLTATDDADFPNALRVFTCLTRYQSHPELVAERDLSTCVRIFRLREQAKSAPAHRLHALVEDWLAEEAGRLKPAEMEAFIGDQFAAQGGFEAVHVELVREEAGEAIFNVELRESGETLRSWPHALSLGYGLVPTSVVVALGESVLGIEQEMIGTNGGAFVMFVATIITGFFIPNMLRKGRIELLLTRPIRRPTLLMCKFVGGLTFMLLNTAILVGTIWLCVGLRTGMWPIGFLLVIFVLTFQFALLYSVSCLVAVLTRSAFAAILATFFTWAVLLFIGMTYLFMQATQDLVPLPDWTNDTITRVHSLTPRYKDMDALTEYLLARDLLPSSNPRRQAMEKAYGDIRWGESVAVSSVFILLVLGLACWRFSARDY